MKNAKYNILILAICIHITVTIKLDKKTEKQDNFTKNDFISKSQLRYLFEILNQKKIFSILPKEIQEMVDNIYKTNSEFNLIKDKNIYNELSIPQKKSTENFIDETGVIGRKGILHFIDFPSQSNRLLYALSNHNTLSLYESQSMSVLFKQYFTNSIIIEDISFTPCFMINIADILCSNTVEEKELWIENINAHLTK